MWKIHRSFYCLPGWRPCNWSFPTCASPLPSTAGWSLWNWSAVHIPFHLTRRRICLGLAGQNNIFAFGHYPSLSQNFNTSEVCDIEIDARLLGRSSPESGHSGSASYRFPILGRAGSDLQHRHIPSLFAVHQCTVCCLFSKNCSGLLALKFGSNVSC